MTETTHTHEAIDRSFLSDARYGACAAVFIEVEHANGFCTLRTSGRFATGADLDYLGAKLDQIRRSDATRVLADFTEVVSMGSTGLSFLIALYRILARESNGRFVLAGANPLVREALDLAHLSKIIPLAKDVESGLAALNSDGIAAVVRKNYLCAYAATFSSQYSWCSAPSTGLQRSRCPGGSWCWCSDWGGEG